MNKLVNQKVINFSNLSPDLIKRMENETSYPAYATIVELSKSEKSDQIFANSSELKSCLKPLPENPKTHFNKAKMKEVTWNGTIKEDTYEPDECFFSRESSYKPTDVHGKLRKIVIKIPIIKYIAHIKKHFNEKPFQLKIDIFCLNQTSTLPIKKQTMSISQYYIHITLLVNIPLVVDNKIYMSIYMVDKLTQLVSHEYDNMDDLFDWTYEFYQISDLIVSQTKYEELKKKYNIYLESCPSKHKDMTEKDTDTTEEAIDTIEETTDTDDEKDTSDTDTNDEDTSDEDTENDETKEDTEKNRDPSDASFIFGTLSYHGDGCSSDQKYIDDSDDLRSSDSSISKKEDSQVPYFITDFYFDVADLIDCKNNIVTLKDFFTQSIVQYFIIDR